MEGEAFGVQGEAKVYACLDGASWTSLSRCVVSGDPREGEVHVRAVPVARADDSPSLECTVPPSSCSATLDGTHTDSDGSPCYVVLWLPRFAVIGELGEERVGVAFRFHQGGIAQAFATLFNDTNAIEELPEAEEEEAAEDAPEDGEALAEPDVDVRVLLSLPGELIRRDEHIASSRPGSRSATARSGGSRGAGRLSGWTSTGVGVVQLVSIRQTWPMPPPLSDRSEDTFESTDTARAAMRHVETVHELVMQGNDDGDAPLLLRHVVDPLWRIGAVKAMLGEGEIPDELAATTIWSEANDPRLGCEDEEQRRDFLLQFDSAVEAAKFLVTYQRLQRGQDGRDEAAVSGEPLGEEDAMGDLHTVFDELMSEFPFAVVRALSTSERHEKSLNSTQLSYSEVEWGSFQEFVRLCRDELKLPAFRSKGGKFVDLGSGVGRAVFAAALSFPFDECVGIELLGSLHEAAVGLLDTFDRTVRPVLPVARQRVAIQFVRDDFTKVPWFDATVAFAISTTFDATVMSKLAALSNDMPLGSVFLTTTTRIPSARWSVRHRFELELAHGVVTAFLHEKCIA
jgi:hypothetical protein